jgi:adenosylmethionine-8-amino-7-oxononanoate aminotransferase
MGNPLAAAVSVASVQLLLSRPWADEVAHIGDQLRAGLAPAAALPGVADVRVLGAIGVVELDEPVPMAESQATVLGRGVWLRPFGRLLYTMPPYISSDDDLDAITSAMVAVVEEIGVG